MSQTFTKGKGWSNSNGKNTIAPPKGESLPVPLVVEILKKAAPVFNKPLGTMLSAYTAGTCCLLEITQWGERGRTFLETYGGECCDRDRRRHLTLSRFSYYFYQFSIL